MKTNPEKALELKKLWYEWATRVGVANVDQAAPRPGKKRR